MRACMLALACVRACFYACRYRVAVRSMRLGYNVLLADDDVIFFDDPYRFMKVGAM